MIDGLNSSTRVLNLTYYMSRFNTHQKRTDTSCQSLLIFVWFHVAFL